MYLPDDTFIYITEDGVVQQRFRPDTEAMICTMAEPFTSQITEETDRMRTLNITKWNTEAMVIGIMETAMVKAKAKEKVVVTDNIFLNTIVKAKFETSPFLLATHLKINIIYHKNLILYPKNCISSVKISFRRKFLYNFEE